MSAHSKTPLQESGTGADVEPALDIGALLRRLATWVSRSLPHFRGKERAVRAFEAWLRHVAPPTGSLPLTVGGVCYALQLDDLIDYRIAYLGGHDRAVTGYLGRVVSGRSVVLWDVGANVGAIALPLAYRHPGLLIEAFEPSPPVVSRLRRNLTLNPALAARIRLHEIALCDRVGVVDFFPSAESRNGGLGNLMLSANTEKTPVRVSAHTGDALIAADKARAPDVVKIDVEGFEYEVLRGLHGFLTRRRDAIVVCEHEPYRLHQRPEAPAVTELLGDLGFTLHALTKSGMLEPLRPGMLEHRLDIVAHGPALAPMMGEPRR